MAGPSPADHRDTATVLRRAVLGLAALGIAGTAVELATLRHWRSGEQLIPWVVLAVLGVAVALQVWRPTPLRVRVVQFGAAVGVIGGVYGVIDHISENYHAAILDYRYTDRWPTMSLVSKLWAASSGAVGPSPVLAPAVLLQIALCLWLATWRHPALQRSGSDVSARRSRRHARRSSTSVSLDGSDTPAVRRPTR